MKKFLNHYGFTLPWIGLGILVWLAIALSNHRQNERRDNQMRLEKLTIQNEIILEELPKLQQAAKAEILLNEQLPPELQMDHAQKKLDEALATMTKWNEDRDTSTSD